MDMQLYNAIKTAMANGQSLDSIMADAKAMAQTAQKELAPQTPIKDKWGKKTTPNKQNKNEIGYGLLATEDGSLKKESLVGAMMAYFCQNGFEPDAVFDSEDDFRTHISCILEDGLATSIRAATLMPKLNEAKGDPAKAAELLFQSIGEMITDRLNMSN